MMIGMRREVPGKRTIVTQGYDKEKRSLDPGLGNEELENAGEKGRNLVL